MPVAVRISLVSLVLVLPVLLGACGPVRSTIVLIQAEEALREARSLGSAESAPYPTEMSARLIEKAKEEQGYSSYDTATVLAEDARMLARDALRIVKESEQAEEASEEQQEASEEQQLAPVSESDSGEQGPTSVKEPAKEVTDPPGQQPVEESSSKDGEEAPTEGGDPSP